MHIEHSSTVPWNGSNWSVAQPVFDLNEFMADYTRMLDEPLAEYFGRWPSKVEPA